MHASARQSDPSGGISAFHGGASMDGTADGGVPTDKYLIGDTASEVMRSNEDRKENEDLQQMYDRIVGTGPGSDMPAGTGAVTGGMGNRQNSYQQQEQSQGNGTLIFNPTINQ